MNITPVNCKPYNSVNQTNLKNPKSPNFKGTIIAIKGPAAEGFSISGLMSYIAVKLFENIPDVAEKRTIWTKSRVFTWIDSADSLVRNLVEVIKADFIGNGCGPDKIKFEFDRRTPEELMLLK